MTIDDDEAPECRDGVRPHDGRFQKGRSGNPAGRPKRLGTASEVISRAARERVTVSENGQRRSMTKLSATAKQMANKAMAGDHRSTKAMLEQLEKEEARREAEGDPQARLAAQKRSDAELLSYLARLLFRDVATTPHDPEA